jgi:hypothetical protein
VLYVGLTAKVANSLKYKELFMGASARAVSVPRLAA